MYGTVANFLKDKIQDGASLSFVSAYFTINAFNALRDSLTGIDNLRFLFGEPDVVGGMDPSKTESKAFRLTMLLFRYGAFLTLAIINRREHQRDPSKQVLEKVTLIKDIDLNSPKRAHIDILSELDLHQLIENEGVRNFDTLHDAWERILNTEALNRRFYRDLEAWYEWASKTCKFPDNKNKTQVIRMITRLLFIWFLKEKDLVPSDIFEEKGAQRI